MSTNQICQWREACRGHLQVYLSIGPSSLPDPSQDKNKDSLYSNLMSKMHFYMASYKKRYMTQPTRFINPQFPNHVCRLHKAMYGLKQSPRAWLEKLSLTLLRLGFSSCKLNTSLFIHSCGSNTTIVLVYVDDLIVIGSSTEV
ncbi:hypothetical protein AABB24_026700 [Solanum stoloniferum]|uniref:Reverse transcriptase Ty1/copia-type domain-containing protein n=1 Tax=Solanum stoloniferum TaxID=62892 RepID=A0ABD2SFY1_9SOLN